MEFVEDIGLDYILFSENFLNIDAFFAVIATASNVMVPPNITDGINPIIFAETPDSKAPNSFEEPTNMLFTAATLPFMLSGVSSCRELDLTTTLILSRAPLRARATAESKKLVDKAKVIMHAPNPPTAISI